MMRPDGDQQGSWPAESGPSSNPSQLTVMEPGMASLSHTHMDNLGDPEAAPPLATANGVPSGAENGVDSGPKNGVESASVSEDRKSPFPIILSYKAAAALANPVGTPHPSPVGSSAALVALSQHNSADAPSSLLTVAAATTAGSDFVHSDSRHLHLKSLPSSQSDATQLINAGDEGDALVPSVSSVPSAVDSPDTLAIEGAGAGGQRRSRKNTYERAVSNTFFLADAVADETVLDGLEMKPPAAAPPITASTAAHPVSPFRLTSSFSKTFNPAELPSVSPPAAPAAPAANVRVRSLSNASLASQQGSTKPAVPTPVASKTLSANITPALSASESSLHARQSATAATNRGAGDSEETDHDELQARIDDRFFSESGKVDLSHNETESAEPRMDKPGSSFVLQDGHGGYDRDEGILEATGLPIHFSTAEDDIFSSGHHINHSMFGDSKQMDSMADLHLDHYEQGQDGDRLHLLGHADESHADQTHSDAATKDSSRKVSVGPLFVHSAEEAARKPVKRKGKSNVSAARESIANVTQHLIKFRNEALLAHVQKMTVVGATAASPAVTRGVSFGFNLREGASGDQGKDTLGKPRRPCYTLLSHSPKPDVYVDLEDFLAHDPLDVLASTTESFWLDVYNASKDDLQMMERVFGLHPLTIEDVLSDDTREKVEVYDEYLFICMHSYSHTDDDEEDEDNVSRRDDYGMVDNGFVHICLFSNYVITFHARYSPSIDRVYKRLRRPGRVDQQRHGIRGDWVLYFLLDEIVELHGPLVDAAETEVESLDDLVLTLSGSEQADMLRRMGSARKRLVILYRRLHPKRDILGSMLSRSIPHVTKNTTLYLRDVLDHILGFLMRIEVSKETLTTAQSQYLGKVSIEVASLSNQIAVVMQRLTYGGTVLLPMTLISGIFGMNIKVPFQLGADDTEINDTMYPFLIVICFMICVALLVLYLVKRGERVTKMR